VPRGRTHALVGTGAAEGTPAEQGTSVALSGDGNTAIVGGPIDNIYVGAAWVFTEPPKPKPRREAEGRFRSASSQASLVMASSPVTRNPGMPTRSR